MQWYGIIYVAGLFILTSLLTVGGFVLQRDKYWMHVWEDLDKPEVKSIKELKACVNKRSCPITSVKLAQGRLDSENK